MKTLKTAVSISEDTFLEAEATARKLGISRSRLFSLAIAEFLERHREEDITRKLNEVYAEEPSDLDPIVAGMQFSAPPDEQWR
jgi:hypothetical protein